MVQTLLKIRENFSEQLSLEDALVGICLAKEDSAHENDSCRWLWAEGGEPEEWIG